MKKSTAFRSVSLAAIIASSTLALPNAAHAAFSVGPDGVTVDGAASADASETNAAAQDSAAPQQIEGDRKSVV